MVLSDESSDSCVLSYPQMRFIKDHLMRGTNQPGEKLRVTILLQSLVTQKVGVSGEHDRPGTEFTFNQYRIVALAINDAP